MAEPIACRAPAGGGWANGSERFDLKVRVDMFASFGGDIVGLINPKVAGSNPAPATTFSSFG
jgi:hypothetical protein